MRPCSSDRRKPPRISCASSTSSPERAGPRRAAYDGRLALTTGTAMADHQRLQELTTAFMDAFNRNDLAAVMAFFADDAVYEELNGRANRGVDAIRAAFAPQFEGKFGRMEFVEDDTFIDAASGKV